MIVIVEPAYNESLFESSITYIESVQAATSETGIVMWKIVTDSVAILLIATIVIGMLRFENRASAFYYVCMLMAYLFVMNIGKLFYH